MVNQFEVLTMTDKQKRDDIYNDLRRLGDVKERQAVRFSSCELLLEGTPGEIALDDNGRERYVSTFSVAYPRTDTAEESKSPRRIRRDRREAEARLRRAA